MNQRFCNGMIHVIRSGDNLYQLSRRYRVPLALILRANPYVDVYNLRPGQEICIPMPCGNDSWAHATNSLKQRKKHMPKLMVKRKPIWSRNRTS